MPKAPTISSWRCEEGSVMTERRRFIVNACGAMVAAAARSRIRRRSAGSASYAFLLKPKSLTVPGSCQPG